MSAPKRVRMVRCFHTMLRHESEWVPMGRARTRCPRCGGEVQDSRPERFHYIELREVAHV